MISVKGASFGRFGGWRRRYPGGSECRSIFLTVSRAMPNRLAASRWLRPSTWQASRTRRYRSTVYILPPSISKKIEGYRWQSFTPPAAGKSRRFRGLICHRRSHPSFIRPDPSACVIRTPIPLTAGATFRGWGTSVWRRLSARPAVGHSPPGSNPAGSCRIGKGGVPGDGASRRKSLDSARSLECAFGEAGRVRQRIASWRNLVAAGHGCVTNGWCLSAP